MFTRKLTTTKYIFVILSPTKSTALCLKYNLLSFRCPLLLVIFIIIVQKIIPVLCHILKVFNTPLSAFTAASSFLRILDLRFWKGVFTEYFENKMLIFACFMQIPVCFLSFFLKTILKYAVKVKFELWRLLWLTNLYC